MKDRQRRFKQSEINSDTSQQGIEGRTGMDGRKWEGQVHAPNSQGSASRQKLVGLQAESSSEACEVQGFSLRQKEAILLNTILLLEV